MASSAVTSQVPAFLAKLWNMVDDPATSHLIAWGDDGKSFIVHNQADLASSLLPYYYKHSNLASFVRQLNMYGFHKVVGVTSGGIKSERAEEMEFAHSCFIRDNKQLMCKIKRKVATQRLVQPVAATINVISQQDSAATSSSVASAAAFVPSPAHEDQMNIVLNEVKELRERQEDMDGKLETMKKENEALWREVVNLRQKHLSQQKIVNKLIQFLVSLVQPRMAGVTGGTSGVKRRFPKPQLAIEGGSGNGSSRGVKEFKLDPNVLGVTAVYSDFGNHDGKDAPSSNEGSEIYVDVGDDLEPRNEMEAIDEENHFASGNNLRRQKQMQMPDIDDEDDDEDEGTSNVVERKPVMKRVPSYAYSPNKVLTATNFGPVISEIPVHEYGGGNSNDPIGSVITASPTVETPLSPLVLEAVDPTLINPAITVVGPTVSAGFEGSPSAGSGKFASQQQRSNSSPKARLTPSSTSAGVGSSVVLSTSPNKPQFRRELSREDVDFDVNTVQKDLDNLKDLLSGQVTFDSSLISSLFSPEDPLPNLFSGNGSSLGGLQDSSVLNFHLPASAGSGQAGSLNSPVSLSSDIYSLLGSIHQPSRSLPLKLEERPSENDANVVSFGDSNVAASDPSGSATSIVDELGCQPTFFELADLEELTGGGADSSSDEPSRKVLKASVGKGSPIKTPGKSSKTFKVSVNRGLPNTADSFDEDLQLNTPLISADCDLDDPLLGSIRSSGKRM